MTIAPLAAIGIVNAACSLIGTLAEAFSRPDPRPVQTAVQPRESVWHQVGKSVDVSAMTREELAAVSLALYENGAIDLRDHAAMSFKSGFAGSSGLMTQPDAAGRVDWEAEFRTRLARHMKDGDAGSAEQDRRVLEILGRLQAGSRGVTSVLV